MELPKNEKSRPFYLITAESGIHLGCECLVACGEDKRALPPCRGAQILRKYSSVDEAVKDYPGWEADLRCWIVK